MVWGRISLTTLTDPDCLRRGSLTSGWYITDILSKHVILFASCIDIFPLVHDNGRLYVANIFNQYLDEVNFVTLPWSSRNADHNTTKHLWNILFEIFNHPSLPQ